MNIGLLGYGVVGSSLYSLIEYKKIIKANIRYVLVKNLNKKRDNIDVGKLTNNLSKIIEDENIDLIIELTGDYDLAYKAIKEALKRKKHVITANKEIIAKHLSELSFIAKENKCYLLFEAAVGGSLPIIDSIIKGTEVNTYLLIEGILNGATNYILSKMDNGFSFKDALGLAKDKGLCENDVMQDLCGFDSLRKICILSMLAFKGLINIDSIYHYGINTISEEDIIFSKAINKKIKLLSYASYKDGLSIYSEPVLLGEDNSFFNVKDEENQILCTGTINPLLILKGLGAGGLPTASAVLLDLMKVIDEEPLRYQAYDHVLPIIKQKYLNRYYVRTKNKQFITDIITHDELVSMEKEFYAKII